MAILHRTLKKRPARLTLGPVPQTLARLTIPMTFGLLAILSFQLADTFFISLLSTQALAALSFTFSITLLISAIGLGVGVGVAAVIARAIGAEKAEHAKQLATDSLLLAGFLSLLLAIGGLLTIDPLFTWLGASATTLPLIRDYMVIWYFSVPFLIVPMIGNSVIRATGDTKLPSLIMMVAGGLNILLDPLLIFGLGPCPALGLPGAAWATLIARFIALLLSLYILIRREQLLTWVRFHWQRSYQTWAAILYIGLPTASTNMLLPLSTALIIRLIAQYDANGVAAFGVGSRIEPLALLIVMAMSNGLAPFIGQNWGAQRFARVRLGWHLSLRFAFLWESTVALLLFLGARPLAQLFSDDLAVQTIIENYLYLLPISYGFLGMFMITALTLNSINKPLHALALHLLRLLGLYLPLAYLGAHYYGITGIFISGSISNIITGVVAYFVGRKLLTR